MALAMKKALDACQNGKSFPNVNKAFAKISPTLTFDLDFDSIKALTGKINWTSKEELDAPIAVLKYFSKSFKFDCVINAFEKITKDKFGKEAVQSEIAKVILHVVQDGTQTGSFAVNWSVEKKDKDVHITMARDWPTHANDNNSSNPGEDALAKLIEALL